MGKYLQRMTHEGKEILFTDFANTREEASLAAWDELKQELLKERGAVLVLIDARNTMMSLAILNKARDVAATLRSIHLNVHFCAALEEGQEWLVSEANQRRQGGA